MWATHRNSLYFSLPVGLLPCILRVGPFTLEWNQGESPQLLLCIASLIGSFSNELSALSPDLWQSTTLLKNPYSEWSFGMAWILEIPAFFLALWTGAHFWVNFPRALLPKTTLFIWWNASLITPYAAFLSKFIPSHLQTT